MSNNAVMIEYRVPRAKKGEIIAALSEHVLDDITPQELHQIIVEMQGVLGLTFRQKHFRNRSVELIADFEIRTAVECKAKACELAVLVRERFGCQCFVESPDAPSISALWTAQVLPFR